MAAGVISMGMQGLCKKGSLWKNKTLKFPRFPCIP